MLDMEVKIYNQEGKEKGSLSLSDAVFGKKIKTHLIHEAVVALQANARRSAAHTKTRGEVSGGGRKPWRQKGTGRARHGSIRSPLWRGGGVTFGPRNERNYAKKINEQARRAAILMALSDKVGSGNLLIIDELRFDKIKTKQLVNLLKTLGAKFPSLVVYPKSDTVVRKIGRNIKSVKLNRADNLHLLDILQARNIVAAKQAIQEIEAKYAK